MWLQTWEKKRAGALLSAKCCCFVWKPEEEEEVEDEDNDDDDDVDVDGDFLVSLLSQCF